ncbi:MAG: MFS transporter, partial [Pseudomonadales bacterium]|nr:MFS transporter [Pseudomonadales bacterium]
WGLAVHLAAIIGPMSYGFISYMSDGDQRLAILSTLTFFVIGLLMLLSIDEQRGKQAAQDSHGIY